MPDAPSQLAANPASVMGELGGGLITFTYDATGLVNVTACAWPMVGWVYDLANPTNPTPIVMGNPLKTPPATGSILSPPWAFIVTEYAAYIPDTGNGGWRGTFGQLMTWLATNNGAHRKIIGQFTVPPLANAWQAWSSANKSLVGP